MAPDQAGYRVEVAARWPGCRHGVRLCAAPVAIAWPWRAALLATWHPSFSATGSSPHTVAQSLPVEVLAGPAVLVLFQCAASLWLRTIHGQEWARYHAMADRKKALERHWPGPGRSVAATEAPSGEDPPSWGRRRERPALRPRSAELAQHVFIPGGSGPARRRPSCRWPRARSPNGYGVVIVDCKGSGLGAEARDLAARHDLPFTLVDPKDRSSRRVRPDAPVTPPPSPTRLIGAFTFAGEAEIYKQVAMEVVPVIGRALAASGTKVTLDDIYESLRPRRAQASRPPARRRRGACRPAWRIWTSPAASAPPGTSASSAASGPSWRARSATSSARSPALDWLKVTAKPHVTYLSLTATAAGEDVELFGRVITQDLKQLCDERMRAIGQGKDVTPVLLVFDEFAALREATQIVDLLLQARQAKAPLVVATQFLPEEVSIRRPVTSAGVLIVHRLEAEDAEQGGGPVRDPHRAEPHRAGGLRGGHEREGVGSVGGGVQRPSQRPQGTPRRGGGRVRTAIATAGDREIGEAHRLTKRRGSPVANTKGTDGGNGDGTRPPPTTKPKAPARKTPAQPRTASSRSASKTPPTSTPTKAARTTRRPPASTSDAPPTPSSDDGTTPDPPTPTTADAVPPPPGSIFQTPALAVSHTGISGLEFREQQRAGVPARYNDGAEWLANGFRRQRAASILGLIFGWTGAWLALWGAVIGFIVGVLIALGVITSTTAGSDLFNLGAGQAITFVSVVSGGVLGIAGGFLAVLKVLFVDRPLQAVVAVISGAIVSVAIVVVAASFERLGLRLRGYRRLSQDEVRRVAPLVKDVADAMNLPALPRFAMDDVVIPNAWTQMRTIVLTKGLLQSLDDGELRAILAHELQHWQSGDSVALHFVWAAAFPAVILYNIGTWLSGSWPVGGQVAKAARTVLALVGWIVAWPSWVLIKLLLVPVIAVSQRRYEYEADAAASRIGLASELTSALRKLTAFESGRTGWEAALAATHPPTELRIERLQPPRPDDWEYQEDELHGPSWIEIRRIFGGLRHVTQPRFSQQSRPQSVPPRPQTSEEPP